MKTIKSLIRTMLVIFFCIIIFTGCEKSKNSFPFTTLTWDSTYDDMTSLEGNDYDSYDSVYTGKTYIYNKDYLGKSGTIKYMFDNNKKLMCVAWSYDADSVSDLDHMYNSIKEELEKTYGKSQYSPSHDTNYGDVWYQDSGDILISALTTANQNALQYSYLNPTVSNKDN